MALATREIKRRIKSIGNTKQITKAMELVSATKMRRATGAALATRPYATLSRETVMRLVERLEYANPLLTAPEKVETIGVLVISSNRSLCGAYNHDIVDAVKEFSATQKKQGRTVRLYTVGSKGRDELRKGRLDVAADFEKLDVVTSIADTRVIARALRDDFESNKVQQVYVAYTDFVSALRQTARLQQVLPLRFETFDHDESKAKKEKLPEYEYILEPEAKTLLDYILPRLFESQVHQALLESNASEHAARMLAMKNASEAAADLIDDLNFTFNQARQASITQEIAEISASKIALAA